MRHLVLKLSLLALAAAPLAARASDLITFTQEGNSADTFSFTVPTSSVVAAADTDGSTYFTLDSVPATYPGGSGSDSVSFYASSQSGGGLYDNTDGATFYGTQLYSSLTPGLGGTYTAVFLPGSGSILGYDLAGIMGVTFDYTITATNATPEPSSLILLGTGALGLVGSMRRRLLA